MISSYKIRYWIILCILIFLTPGVFAQGSIVYGYDANGNRTTRVLVVEQYKSKGLNVPVEKLKDIPSEVHKEELKEVDKGIEIESEGEVKTLVYPNPNKGLIKIEIVNLPQDSKIEARLYDFSGTELIVKRNFESHYEMDISYLKDGIYILRIKINENLFDWKVIKRNR